MKKLLITTDSFLPRWDGVSRFLSEIIPFLSKSYNITIVCPKFPGLLPGMKARIIQLPLSHIMAGDIPLTHYQPKIIRGLVKKADIVFNQSLGPIGYAAIKSAKKFRKPVISYTHSIDWELFSKSVKYCKSLVAFAAKFYVRRLYNKCSLLFVPSTTAAQELEKAGIKIRKVVVPLGVNIKHFLPSRNKAASKKKLNIPENNFVIGYCGRIAREKNLGILHQAFNKINSKYPNTKLLIVGEGLKDETEKLQGKNVIITGKQEYVVPFYQAMDIYVLPSLTETSSLSTMEAMACGIPPIVTPVGHLRDYIQDGENGFFFPIDDVKELTQKIEDLIKNKQKREEIAKKARQTASKKFSWTITARIIKKNLHL